MTNGIVVVLGKTGKNFAAGMSGGLAYVLDEPGDFASSLCNRDMVDLEPLDAEDQAMLNRLIHTHVALTGSPRGTEILSRQEEYFPRFVKVFPHDYKRVLASSAAAQQRSAHSRTGGGQWVNRPGFLNTAGKLPPGGRFTIG